MELARSDHAQLELLKNELAAQEAQWKEAYDVLVAENNSLRASGSEALLAAQWRQRYEHLLAEKEDLESRLNMEVEKADVAADQRRKVDAGKYELKYRDLKESFRLYRKKAKEIFEAQQRGDVGVRDYYLLRVIVLLFSLLEKSDKLLFLLRVAFVYYNKLTETNSLSRVPCSF